MSTRFHHRRAVVALGGNAITRPGDSGAVEEDFRNLEASLDGLVGLVEQGWQILLTHGNGPQVGNQMIRVELSAGQAPELPLDVMVADIQGGLGYMIESVLRAKFRRRGLSTRICCLLSMVEVDAADPAFADPTKFVGRFYTAEQASALRRDRGWVMKEDKGRGWRRVVPSPDPRGIVEWQEILQLMDSGCFVISAGGGGIPVARTASGEIHGVECVVDKDRASAVLALAVGAPELIILTGVEQVMLDYATPNQRPVASMNVLEARRLLAEGQFPEGSMGPKIDAACRFVEGGGSRTLITDVFTLTEALAGRTGTWVTA